VARITKTTTVFSAPGGHDASGTVYATTRSAPTWLPVLAQRADGWTQIRWLNGTRPATGWVHVDNAAIADTRAYVEVFLAARVLVLHQTGRATRTWKLLAVGDAGSRWPTPTGSYWTERVGVDPNAGTVYGAGPYVETSDRGSWAEANVIGVHSWNAAIAKNESSHGCIRALDATVLAVSGIPLGSPFLIRP
jgi:lipoprotein-anchoring transpeptidase ErfK/SrfK